MTPALWAWDAMQNVTTMGCAMAQSVSVRMNTLETLVCSGYVLVMNTRVPGMESATQVYTSAVVFLGGREKTAPYQTALEAVQAMAIAMEQIENSQSVNV